MTLCVFRLLLPGNNPDLVAALLDKAAVRQSIIDEIDLGSGSPETPVPSSLALAESVNIKVVDLAVNPENEGDRSIESDINCSSEILHRILAVVSDHVPRHAHIHECFADGLSYRDWLTQAALAVADAEGSVSTMGRPQSAQGLSVHATLSSAE